MASLKEIRGRIASINSTQQITRAMKMVSAAKLRKAQDAIIRMRPYAQKLNAIMANVAANMPDDAANAFAVDREPRRVLLIPVTSDRSLCGAFNTNVIRTVSALIAGPYSSQAAAGNVTILPVGKKGNEYFGRRIKSIVPDYVHLFANINFAQARTGAEFAMEGFINADFDRVIIVYNEFKNVATQIVRTEQLLPVAQVKPETAAAAAKFAPSKTDYIFQPSAEHILGELIPQTIKIQFYKALLESNAGEHGARMTAMEKATENAGELLKELKLTYNRTRQAAITKEILEIVGGAEALSAK